MDFMAQKRLFPIPTNVLPPEVDKFMGFPVIFTLIVLFQGCFGGLGIVQTPKRLEGLISHPIARFIFLFAIAYTATSDVETAAFATVLFLVGMHLLRSEEEKKKLNGQYF